MNNWKKEMIIQIAIMLAIFALAISVGLYFAQNKNPSVGVKDNKAVSSQEKKVTEVRSYEGKKYTLNPNIKTVLFMGIDTREKVENENGAGHNGQADCILLFLMNKETKTCSILQISRETMTDVDLYTEEGKYYSSENAQLALQYAYGDGGKKSSWLMKKAVGNILGEVPINSDLALNIDGIVKITEVLGGVEITIPKDYTDINPAFVEGATITLNGEQAEQYVRTRDITVTGSNLGRMERQNQFILAMFSKLKAVASQDRGIYARILSEAGDYITTDMNSDELKAYASYKLDENINLLPGVEKAGKDYDEYWLDEQGVKQMVQQLFYVEQ